MRALILAWLSVAFIVGLALGDVHPIPVAVCLGIALVLAVAAVLARGKLLLPLLIAAAFSLGFGRAIHASTPGPTDLAYYVGHTAHLQGTISAEPDIRDTSSNYRIEVNAITVRGVVTSIHGTLVVHSTHAVQLEYGDSLRITGRLLHARLTDGRGVNAEMRFPRILDTGATNTGLLGLINGFRGWLEGGINRWLPEPEAALLIAITLGAKSASLGDLAPVLVQTGLIHLVAISGIKVAMVAGTVHQLAQRAGSRLFTLCLSLIALFGYVLLTGATPAGLRSAGMWTMIFLATYLGRSTLGFVSLGLVVALMLGHDPSLFYDLGFRMSAVGTFGILVLAGPIQRFAHRLPSPFLEALATSLAAQIYTLPIVIEGFSKESTSGPLANTLVLPLVPFLILLGFAIGCLAALPLIAAPTGAASYALLHLIVVTANTLVAIPTIPLSPLSPLVVVLYYSLCGPGALAILQRIGWPTLGLHPPRKRELAIALVAASSFLTVSAVAARGDPGSSLYWLGSGNAVLVQSHGSNALIDGSPRPLELLQRLGSLLPGTDLALDVVVVTDPRAANVGGLVEVLKHYSVSEVLDVGAEYPSGSYARWRAAVRNRGILVSALRTGTSVQIGDVAIRSLGPDSTCPLPQNCAGIVELREHGKTVVLAGSASLREQHETVFRGVLRRADTIVCGPVGCESAFVKALGMRKGVPFATLPTDQVSSLIP